jgi:hypothetical protein
MHVVEFRQSEGDKRRLYRITSRDGFWETGEESLTNNQLWREFEQEFEFKFK